MAAGAIVLYGGPPAERWVVIVNDLAGDNASMTDVKESPAQDDRVKPEPARERPAGTAMPPRRSSA
jgi:hypothetical protein